MIKPLSIRSILFCTIFIGDLITGKKVSSTGHATERSGKLNECIQCKLLSDSFNHWLDKTSRGKYDGGDAAWEESKLKSYARSEVRLVEVQEGLCSELKKHQDKCYLLAEEAESALEKWWFNEDPQSVDLYTWLCIETLQHCCPKQHYGESCYPCPVDKNNVLCGGNGHCSGDGTRKGNGSCICNVGYTGKYCEVCTNNFYSKGSGCNPCHKSCEGCTGEGPGACKECRTGWEMVAGMCTDINECSDLSSCKDRQYCINQEGSYKCIMCDRTCKSCSGRGFSNCTSCEDSSVLWSGFCINDELKSDILRNTLKRAALYSGLLIIAFILFRNSKSLASITILIIAIYIYYSEKSSEMNILDVVTNLYLS